MLDSPVHTSFKRTIQALYYTMILISFSSDMIADQTSSPMVLLVAYTYCTVYPKQSGTKWFPTFHPVVHFHTVLQYMQINYSSLHLSLVHEVMNTGSITIMPLVFSCFTSQHCNANHAVRERLPEVEKPDPFKKTDMLDTQVTAPKWSYSVLW